MTREERELALYCLKASSDYHSEVCEKCINYPNCDHTIQDDVTETIIKALEQEPKTGHWEWVQYDGNPNIRNWHCSECGRIVSGAITACSPVYSYKFCPNCGAKMNEGE